MSQAPGTEVPAAIRELDRLMLAQLALQADLQKQIAAFHGQLCQVMESPYERSGIQVRAPYERQVVYEYLVRVEALAVRMLSTPDAPFEVPHDMRPDPPDNEQILAARCHEEAFADCLPSAYWKALYATYDPEAQRRQAARRAAIALAEMVGIVATNWKTGKLARVPTFTPPKVVKGCVELAFRGIYPDCTGRISVDQRAWGCVDAIGYAIRAAHPQPIALPQTLQEGLENYRKLDRFESRRRVELGDGAYFVAYRSGYKLYLPVKIAESINLFISEHLDDVLAVPE